MLKGHLIFIAAFAMAAVPFAQAAQLSTEARASIPRDVQQLIVIDYREVQNSTVASDLRDRAMPPSLKIFSDALAKSGLNDNRDVDQLAFALIGNGESSDRPQTVGIAQGRFDLQNILANFHKQKIKTAIVRTYKLYPLPNSGMVVCMIDQSTMLFGGFSAVKKALDARDGESPSLLKNDRMMDAMKTVDSSPLWSVLDSHGTQEMIRQALGGAGSVTNFDSVREHLQGSSYAMDFQHGVKFDLTLSTGDSIAATTLASLLNAAVTVRKLSASDEEKQALSATSIDSDAGRLVVHFAASESDFNGLMNSSLFQSMTR